MTDHIPPNDVEAEIAVLGSLLLLSDPLAAKKVTDLVTHSDFYRDAHAQVFRAERNLWETTAACDPLLLRAQMQEDGTLERVGGTSFISRIVASVPSAANAALYASIVRHKRLERDVLSASMLHESAARENGNGVAEAAFRNLTATRDALYSFDHPTVAKEAKPTSWDLADLSDEPDDPPPDEFVSRLFVRPSFNIVFGPPQAGKSWAVMALCLDAVLGGGNFLGSEDLYITPLREIRDGRPEVCLWVFGSEDTKSRVKRRLKTLHASGPHSDKQIPRGAFVIATPPNGISLHMPDGWAWLQAKIAEVNPSILVLDTIASLTGSSLDVNKNEQVIPFIAQINALRSDRNMIVFGLHHTRKGSTDPKKSSGTMADAMLGAAAWRGLSEGVLMLDAPDGDTSKVTFISVKAKDIDRPVPKFTCTLESPGGRFRPLAEDEQAPERDPVKKGGRPLKFSAEKVLSLREKHPSGVVWREVQQLLDIVESTWFDKQAEVLDALNRAGCVVIQGELRWPTPKTS